MFVKLQSKIQALRYSLVILTGVIFVVPLSVGAYMHIKSAGNKSDTLKTSNDTYVSQGAPAKSFSSDPALAVKLSMKSSEISYIKLDVNNVNGKLVKSSKLSLYSLSAFNNVPVDIYLVPKIVDTTTMTWSTRPSLAGAQKIGSLQSGKASAWSTVALEQPVWTDGPIELALVGNSKNEVKFASFESAHIPKLTFVTEDQKVLPLPPVITIAANPTSVVEGGSTMLSWTSTNAPKSCTASGDWSGSKQTLGTEEIANLKEAKTYNFNLTCANSSGSGMGTTTITVTTKGAAPADPGVKTAAGSPPAVTISVNPGSLTAGGSTTATWSSTNNPKSCTASGDWSGSKSNSGSEVIANLASVKTYNFTLTCTNDSGTDSATAHATVNAASGGGTTVVAPVVTITSNPASIVSGNSSTLTWSTTNSPASCTASGDWSGTKSSSGSVSTGALSSTRTYTYSLSCTNTGGSGSASATVAVSAGGTTVAPPYTCNGPVNNLRIVGTGHSNNAVPAVINIASGCTGSLSFDITVDDHGDDGVKVQAGAHDLNITSGNIVCADTTSTNHQDGVQVQGGSNITFHNLTVSCPNSSGAGAFYIDGKDFGSISNVICDGCDLKHYVIAFIYTTGKAPNTVNSGVRNSVLHQSPYQGNRCFTNPTGTDNMVNDNNTCVP